MKFREMPDQSDIISRVFGDRAIFKKKVKEYYNASKAGGYEIGSNEFHRAIIGGIKISSKEDWNKCIREIIIEVDRLKKREEYKKKQLIKDAQSLEEKEEKRRTGLDTKIYEEFNSDEKNNQ